MAFTNLIEFFRKYRPKNSENEFNCIEFKVKLTQTVIDDILSLHDIYQGEYREDIIQTITINTETLSSYNFKERLTHYIGKTAKFSFSDVAGCTYFYRSFAEFTKSNNRKKPEYFYISDIDLLSYESSKNENIVAYDKILRIIDLLNSTDIVDHSHKNNHNQCLTFYILGSEKIEFDSSFTAGELKVTPDHLDNLIREIENYSKSQSHKAEKRNIFRKSLSDIIKSCHKKSSRFAYLLNHSEEFLSHFNGSMDLYLNEFSFGKFMDDVSEKKLAYIEKMNKIVSDIGLKLLILPIIGMITTLIDKPLINSSRLTTTLYSGLMMLLLLHTADSIYQIKTDAIKSFKINQKRDKKAPPNTVTSGLYKAYQQLNLRLNIINFFIFGFYILMIAIIAYIWKYNSYLETLSIPALKNDHKEYQPMILLGSLTFLCLFIVYCIDFTKYLYKKISIYFQHQLTRYLRRD